jgi:CRP-like cAMP-binding protein
MDAMISKKIDEFFKQFKHQTYKKGEILVRADEDLSGVFYLTKGMVKQYAISNKGEELVINIFKPVSFFPMSWAINQTPNNYYFEALEELEIIKAPREDVVTFVKDNPDVLFDLISRVYKGMDGLLSRMVYLMSGEAKTRVIIELLIAAKRFGRKKDGEAIELKISEKDIANQAGMARETVSREISKLKEKGLISLKNNRLLINDLHKLEDELTYS